MPPAAQVAFTTPYRTAPYLTVQEYRTAPTGVNTSDLAPGGQPNTEDAILADVIGYASGWIDDICNQILAATVDTEAKRLRPSRDGSLIVPTDNWPILEVRDVQYGTTPAALQQLGDLTGLWIEERQFIVTASGLAFTTSAGPLQLGGFLPGRRLLVRYTYVNGWPNALLAADVATAAVSITVTDPTGIYAGTRLRVDTGALEELVTVSATPTTSAVAISALTHDHKAGVSVTALPPVVKQAAILLTSALIKTRSQEALVMPALAGIPELGQVAQTGGGSRDVADAKEMLLNLQRTR